MAEYVRRKQASRSSRNDGSKRSSTVAATEAAKNFGTLIDRVREAGVAYTIERGGVPVAQVSPVRTHACTVADLVSMLQGARRLPEEFLAAVDEHVAQSNTPEVPGNPWTR